MNKRFAIRFIIFTSLASCAPDTIEQVNENGGVETDAPATEAPSTQESIAT